MASGLEATINYILEGKPVYAGCMGGIGRTGLLLALVLKAWGDEAPVATVRKQYYPHAVETSEQMRYIKEFEIDPKLKRRIRWGKIKNLFKSNKLLTNW
jgi:protein-tyrosine phosphatase